MSIFGPRFRDDDPNFLARKSFYDSIGTLLASDSFVSKKQYLPLVKKCESSFATFKTLDSNNTLNYWGKKTKTDLSLLKLYLYAYEHVEDNIKRHNKQFVSHHLTEDEDYLDHILSAENPHLILDEDQRRVVLSDEDYTLVIAGAGAGKTTTLEAKAKYLVEKKHVDPARILVISFTKKATQELSERFNAIKIPAKIVTFHSIGNSIIHQNQGRYLVKGPGFRFEVIRSFLETKLDDKNFIDKITLFFASYLEMPFETSKSIEIYKRTLQNQDLITRKTDLENYQETLTKKKITIQSERVRSYQECQIANFLYINGINYEYEPIYPYCISDSNKPYTPDFKLIQGDNVVYLEHFGINEDGTNWRFSKEELDLYKRHIRDKIRFHRAHNTKLIYTFSNYNDGKDLVFHLKRTLEENGFVLHQRDSKEIYYELAKRAEDRYFIKLVQLICNFINRFKNNNYKLEKFSDFQAVARENKDERTLLFLDIARQCYIHYEAALKELKGIDFEDRINNAAEILDDKIRNKEKIPYDYIFIDEYQDISFQRFNLAEKLSQCSDAKILAVGDDWQSIFRFSGSDINLFIDFEKRRGYADVLYLRNTHRNSQELVNVAAGFIRKNELQRKKSLKSPKHLNDPIVVLSYDDSYSSKGDNTKELVTSPYYRMGKAIETALEDIVSKFGEKTDILLIGRYNFDGKKLSQLSDRFLCTEDRRIRSKKFPKANIKFLTAHSSKGLGADNVIVINGKDDILGFPSKIEDDPIRKLVLSNAKEMDFAEERRLFYVALTRTKNRVYLVTPRHTPSAFIRELRNNHTNIILNGPQIDMESHDNIRYKCPYCGYPLQIKKKKNKFEKEFTLYVCSNDPEVCGFVTNDLSGGKRNIRKCPDCESGYLVVKRVKNSKNQDTGERILGCTNYKKDGSGCNYRISSANFGETWEKTSRNKSNYIENGKKLPLNKCILAGYPIKQLRAIIRYPLCRVGPAKDFSFSVRSLTDYLVGKTTKASIAYRFDDCRGFGCIEEKNEKLLFALINRLPDFGFLEIKKEDRYSVLSSTDMELSDNLCRKIFELFVH